MYNNVRGKSMNLDNRNLQHARVEEKTTSDLDQGLTFGDADGPDTFVDSLGIVVPTFLDPRDDLIPPKARGYKRVRHHIPFKMRGYFKSTAWPETYREQITFTVDEHGYVICTALNKAGKKCSNLAANRMPFCRNHGGGLHPLDKKMSIKSVGDAPVERVAGLDRPQKFMQGFITVEELADEEVSGMYILNDAGQRVRSTALGVKIHQQIAQELHRRLNRFLQTKTASMLEVMVDIAESELVEPADRIKAAQWVAERTLGKTPEVLIHAKTEQPYESIFQTIDAGSRQDYREKVSSTRLELGGKPDEIFDVEVIEEPQDSSPTRSDSGNPDRDSRQPDPGSSLEYARSVSDRRDQASREQEIKKARTKAKQRRYAARAVGATNTQDMQWLIEWKFLPTGNFRMKLVCPDDQTPARLDRVTKSNAEALEKAQAWRNNVTQ